MRSAAAIAALSRGARSGARFLLSTLLSFYRFYLPERSKSLRCSGGRASTWPCAGGCLSALDCASAFSGAGALLPLVEEDAAGGEFVAGAEFVAPELVLGDGLEVPRSQPLSNPAVNSPARAKVKSFRIVDSFRPAFVARDAPMKAGAYAAV
jgi:hypothetical protein